MTNRVAIMAHFDVDGQLAEHVRRNVEALLGVVDRLIVVTTATLTPEARGWLVPRVSLIERANYGYDFLSYSVGLQAAAEIADYDEVVLCNDSFVGPLRPYERIFAEMAERPVDFWGLTMSRRIKPHVQSFFAVFRRWVLHSPSFTRFWANVVPLFDRTQVIRQYEVGMSTTLTDAGFLAGSSFTETPEDVVTARRRMRWWALQRPPGLRHGVLPTDVMRTRAREPWNPSIALADRALPDGRLPLVKIDTLRFDPYGLGAERLLAACEARFPAEFGGVRDYLLRTATSYPRRAREDLLPTPLPLRPLGQAVSYLR